MEVCGTHTVALRREGIHSILPPNIRLISGPGCPVCVTPANYIDNAIKMIHQGATIVTFGDMIKVPSNSGESLASYLGRDSLKTVYSPYDLIKLRSELKGPLVFLGIGFETTIPAIMASFKKIIEDKTNDIYLYSAFKTVPNALKALLSDKESHITGFLLPGHVSMIIGEKAYLFLNEYQYKSITS